MPEKKSLTSSALIGPVEKDDIVNNGNHWKQKFYIHIESPVIRSLKYQRVN